MIFYNKNLSFNILKRTFIRIEDKPVKFKLPKNFMGPNLIYESVDQFTFNRNNCNSLQKLLFVIFLQFVFSNQRNFVLIIVYNATVSKVEYIFLLLSLENCQPVENF